MGGHFELDSKKNEIELLEKEMKQEGFWNDIELANEQNKKLSNLKKIVEEVENIENNIVDNLELINILEEPDFSILENDAKKLKSNIEDLEIKTMLNGKFDNLNCYLEIHPGAGGTESCDWASILLRMYQRFC